MVKTIILSGYGLNCERETKEVLDFLGSKTKIVHINDLINKEDSLENYDLLVFPGGFSYGDDVGSGKAYASRIRNNLWDSFKKFKENGGLAIGICNGFQIMSHLGLFSESLGEKEFSLLHNDSARYLCKWVKLKINQNSKCIFTKGMEEVEFPIAHGEGKFFSSEEKVLELEKNNQIVLSYIDNPNGSQNNIAGICDQSGRFFGLMPHPERAAFFHNHPKFHKRKELLLREGKEIPYEGEGVIIFKNAIDYVRDKK